MVCIFEIPHRIELVRQYCLFNQPIAEKPKSDATHPWTSRPPQPFLLSSGCCALQQEVTGKWFYSTGIPVPQIESSFRPPPFAGKLTIDSNPPSPASSDGCFCFAAVQASAFAGRVVCPRFLTRTSLNTRCRSAYLNDIIEHHAIIICAGTQCVHYLRPGFPCSAHFCC